METVEISHDAANAGFHTCSEMRSGMKNKRADAELIAAEHFIGE